MTKMKRFIGAALMAGAAFVGMAGAAHADDLSITGNVALTTDYRFRGISQTQDAGAIQGGFDLTYKDFYAGTWASNLNFGSAGLAQIHVPMELDLYAGWRPKLGPISADIGVIAYTYPDAGNPGSAGLPGDWNYYELKVSGTVPLSDAFTLGGAVYYSPEWALKGGSSYYAELNGAWTVSPALSISGAVGYAKAGTDGYFVQTSGSTDNYTTWNVGATYTTHGFGIDLRYVGNSENDITLFSPTEVSDDAVILTLKRAL